MMAVDIQTASHTHAAIEVFREIEARLHAITPDKYRRSTTVRTRHMVALGSATERMKQLYTLNTELAEETARLHRSLLRTGTDGHEEEFVRLNQVNLRQRIVALVLGVEVGQAFSHGRPFDLDEDWVVVTSRD